MVIVIYCLLLRGFYFNIFNIDVYICVFINIGILYIKLILVERIENWSS